jgi:hypothetical protein
VGLKAEERNDILSPGDDLHEPGLGAEERNEVRAPGEGFNGAEWGDLNAAGEGLLGDLYEPGDLEEVGFALLEAGLIRGAGFRRALRRTVILGCLVSGSRPFLLLVILFSEASSALGPFWMALFANGFGFDSSAISSSTCISTSRLSSAVSFFVSASFSPTAAIIVLDLRTLGGVSAGEGFIILLALLVLLIIPGGTRDSLADFFGAIFRCLKKT